MYTSYIYRRQGRGGAATVAVDRGNSASLKGGKNRAQHAADIGKVIAEVKIRTGGAAVWLVGTSAGTLSATGAGARLSGADPAIRPSGLVLTSTMTTLVAALFGAPVKDLKIFAGGSPPLSGPCDARSAHGFFGIEDSVVEFIADWIKSR